MTGIKTAKLAHTVGQEKKIVRMNISKIAKQRTRIKELNLCFDQGNCPKPQQKRALPLRRQRSGKAARIPPEFPPGQPMQHVLQELNKKSWKPIPGIKPRTMGIKTAEPAHRVRQDKSFVQTSISKIAEQHSHMPGLAMCFKQANCPKPQKKRFTPPRRQWSGKAARIRFTPRVPRMHLKQKYKYSVNTLNKKWDEKYVNRKQRLMKKMEVLVKALKKLPFYDREPGLNCLLSCFSMGRPKNPRLDSFSCTMDKTSVKTKPNPLTGPRFDESNQQRLPSSSSSLFADHQKSEETVSTKKSGQSPPSLKTQNEFANGNTKNKTSEAWNELMKLPSMFEMGRLQEELAKITMNTGKVNLGLLWGSEDTYRARNNMLDPLPFSRNMFNIEKPRLDPSLCSTDTYRSGKTRLDPLPGAVATCDRGKTKLESLPWSVATRRPGKSRLDALALSVTKCRPGKLWPDPLPCSKDTCRSEKPGLDHLPCSLNKCNSKRPTLEPYIGTTDINPIKSTKIAAHIPAHLAKLLKKRASLIRMAPVVEPDKENAHFTFQSTVSKEKNEPEPQKLPAILKEKFPIFPSAAASSNKKASQHMTAKQYSRAEIKTPKSEPDWCREEILSSWLHHLKSDEWNNKIQAMKNITALAEKNPNLLKTKLHEVCFLLTLEVKNQRATLALAAINTIKALHFYLQKAMDPEAAMTCRALLLKFAQTTNPIVHGKANLALDVLVRGCSPTRVLPVFINMGLNHLSNAVRVTTARHLHQLAEIVGGETLLASDWLIVEHLVPAVSKMSMNGSREVRHHGQKILQELVHQDQFMKLLRRLVPPKERIHLNKILRKMNQNTTRHV